MAANDRKKGDLTDLNNQENIIKLSPYQLSEEIHKMLKERTKAQAAMDLEYALPCFEVDWWGAVKKIKDTSFDPVPITSSSKVKIDENSSDGITHDERAKMIIDNSKLVQIEMLENLTKLMIGERRNNMKF